jgi:hypothetical protein
VNIWLSLPALTAAEAEQLLQFVDMLQAQLWEAYADAVLDTAADREPSAPPGDASEDIPF